MFGKRIHLFKLFGFKVGIDITWFFLAIFITWSLAEGLFPTYFKDIPQHLYWWMAIFGMLGLFGSIVFHEFCHSLVARRYGIPMKGITLFIFGGVAEMSEEPVSPKAEFLMAIAGPLSSFFLAGVLYLLNIAASNFGLPLTVQGVLWYLALINLVLACFNLIPAFPLDGGRVLRSILWGAKKNIRWATRISSKIGSGFGLFLIFVGIINIIGGQIISGMWQVLIGMFIRGASSGSYQQLMMKEAFKGEHVSDFMKTDPVTVPPDITIYQLVTDYIYKHHYKMFPVTRDGELLGCVSTADIKKIPREEWEQKNVGDILSTCSEENSVTEDTDATRALTIMNQSGNSRLIVVRNGELAGIITLKDMLDFFSLKIDLEGE